MIIVTVKLLYHSFFISPPKLLIVFKVALLFFLLTAFQNISEEVKSPHNITIQVNQVEVQEVLGLIENLSNFSVFYREYNFQDFDLVDIDVRSGTIEDVLEQLFEQHKGSYHTLDNIIIITFDLENEHEFDIPEDEPRLLTGKVISSTFDEPLIGATIQVKDENIGTATDLNGEFKLLIPPGKNELIVRYLGYETQKVTLSEDTNVTIRLIPTTLSTDDVVVIGYGRISNQDLTSSISIVPVENFERTTVTSIGAAIQGKASGVQVIQPSGKPGANLSILIRGSSSILADNQPLYVVDGVPTNSILLLNPRDVESINILKDASAAAIYGSRGANGVVLITTKRGSAEESKITFNSSIGTATLPFQLETLNTSQYRELMKEIMGTDIVPASNFHTTNWMDETFGTGFYQDHQLSISGGIEQMRYYISLSYLHNKGIVNPASNERYNFRLNLNNQVFDWLNVTTNFSYNKRNRRDAEHSESIGRGGIVLSAINTPPFLEILDPNNPDQFQPNPYQPSWENPLAYMSRAGYDNGNRLFGNIISEISLNDNWGLRSNFGLDYDTWSWTQYVDPIRTVFGRQENGRAEVNKNKNYNWLLENTINYNKEWNYHRVNFVTGITAQENNWDLSYMAVRDFPETTSFQTLNAANQTIYGGTLASEWALLSYLSRLSYSYQSKYMLTATMRYDGSSRLAEGNRWGLFPSVSAAWRLSSESFMDNITFIDDLKIRAGWGKTGNQEGISEYASFGLFQTNRQPQTDPLSGPSIERITYENKDLRWETTTQTNVGIDLLLWNGRLGLTADAYIKKTDDLLLNVEVPKVGAANFITRNDGKMENRGLEFAIESQNIRGDFNWNTEFNISFNRNEVTELGLNTVYNFAEIYTNNEYVIRLEPGFSLGTFYGYIAEGVDPETGMIIYRDLDGTGTITANDRTVIGNAQPDFVYGMTNSFSYRGFDLSLFLQGSYGNDIFNASRLDTEGMFDHKNQTTRVLDRWREPGDITDMPRATRDMSNIRNSTRFVEDGSYLRIKQVTLSYQLTEYWLQNTSFKGITLYTTAENLFTFTNYSGFDPEVNAFGTSNIAFGVDYGTYPHARSIIFGINIEL